VIRSSTSPALSLTADMDRVIVQVIIHLIDKDKTYIKN
jgi:hypothetical protein